MRARHARALETQHIFRRTRSTPKCRRKSSRRTCRGQFHMRADDLSDMFNYAQTPLAFKQIPAAPLSAADQNDTRAGRRFLRYCGARTRYAAICPFWSSLRTTFIEPLEKFARYVYSFLFGSLLTNVRP